MEENNNVINGRWEQIKDFLIFVSAGLLTLSSTAVVADISVIYLSEHSLMPYFLTPVTTTILVCAVWLITAYVLNWLFGAPFMWQKGIMFAGIALMAHVLFALGTGSDPLSTEWILHKSIFRKIWWLPGLFEVIVYNIS